MTQQYISEVLAFESEAMPHGQSEVSDGADERRIEQDIHARIQGQTPKAPAPRKRKQDGGKQKK
ncbi:MAG: hypothetical protein CVV27_00320 [Candidatus Melainabacteria bacterium HGW-Melainabacteria-1]|nr:MAG: hypothetical protein CVV27_00320 [Candidatus Melainabacteria bacterium HGW-Melainabacteria-1]